MLLDLKTISQITYISNAFRTDRRGAVAIIFAVSLTLLLPLFAFTVDYGVASLTKAKLDAAADSAILAATVAAADAYVGNGGKLAEAQAAGISAGQQWFSSQLQLVGFPITPAPPSPDINIYLNNTTFNATLTYTATSPSYFVSVFGRSFYDILGGSNSTYTLPGYLDLLLMVDNSPSMTIIADLANWPGYADYLYTNYNSFWKTKGQSTDCMFACHDKRTVSDTSQPNTDLYYIAEEYAKKIGVNLLRIDVVGAAIQSVLQTIQATQANDHYRVGLYTFSDSAQQIFALSSDFRGAAASAKTIVPLASGGATYRTDLPSAVSDMINNNYLTKAGDGLSASNPKKTLLLITDGTNDHVIPNDPVTAKDPVTTFDTAQCQKIKDFGIIVYVLYTKYYPVKSFYPGSTHPGSDNGYNNAYKTQVMPLQNPSDQIQASLQSCASTPDKYYSVSDAASIKAALASILTAALAQPGRFTQ